jgi:tRNA pseudouridine55 synthase
VEAAVGHLPKVELDAEEATAAGHGKILGPAEIVGPYGVFGPNGSLIGVWIDDGPKARPQVVLSQPQ